MSGLIIEPEVVAHERKQREKQHQLERRGIARELLPAIFTKDVKTHLSEVETALMIADELLAKTKVEP